MMGEDRERSFAHFEDGKSLKHLKTNGQGLVTKWSLLLGRIPMQQLLMCLSGEHIDSCKLSLAERC